MSLKNKKSILTKRHRRKLRLLGNGLLIIMITSDSFEVVLCRKIPHNVWVHVAASWNEEKRQASVFFNGRGKGRHIVNQGKSSYRAMINSHDVYMLGAESKTKAESGGKTLHGFIKELKVFKRALNKSEILRETSLSNASGT